MTLSRPDLDSAHNWFQVRGVPMVIPSRERLTMMIPHSVPVTAWLILSALCYSFLWSFLLYIDGDTSGNPGSTLGLTEDQFYLSILGVTAAMPVLLLIVPWLLRHLARRLSLRGQFALGLILVSITLVIFSPLYTFGGERFTDSWWDFSFFALILFLVLFFELDVLLIWAGRQTLRELGMLMPMVAKVLPVLMIAVLFIFVNGDVWKVANNLSNTRTLQVFGILFLLAFFVTVTTSTERTRRLLGSKTGDYLEDFSLEEYYSTAQSAAGLWPSVVKRVPPDRLTSSRKISWMEWVNFITLPVLSQIIQALIFAVMVFFFFLWFGSFAIPQSTVAGWLGEDPAHLSLAGLTIPLSAVLVKVSVIIAGFASLNFVSSTAADEPSRWVGSIITLDAVSQQLDTLKETLGENYRDENGLTPQDHASASVLMTRPADQP